MIKIKMKVEGCGVGTRALAQLRASVDCSGRGPESFPAPTYDSSSHRDLTPLAYTGTYTHIHNTQNDHVYKN